MFKIPSSFMDQFTVRECPDCGLEHAPIRTCDEAREFHAINNRKEA